MKRFTLILSVGITLVIFSLSFTSGSSSNEMSLKLTNSIYEVLSNLFRNLNINIDQLNIIVRKSAHVFEYSILAISWFYTMKAWEWSFAKLLLLGLVIAAADESIQLIADNRGPSIVDVLIFDYLPFLLISLILLSINQRKEEVIMSSDTLMKLQNNSISTEKAYKELFRKKTKRVPFARRAHFIKLRIIIPDQKGATNFLRVLFALPMPIAFLRVLLSFVKMDQYADDMPMTKGEIVNLISHKNIRVQVNTKSGEKILIKTI